MSFDPTARRNTPLALQLANEITRDGPISVADYMRRCLWDPQHGYYATRLPLGQAGDFITAPEISQTFGELIGLWAAVIWRDLMNRPTPFTLAELGPGRGTMMRDCLRATAKVPGFHASLICHLIEASQPLIAMQQAALAPMGVSMNWSTHSDAIEAPAIVIANEFFDAMPVEQWIKVDGGWAQRSVEVDRDGHLQFGRRSTIAAPDFAPENANSGSITESQRPETTLAGLAKAAAQSPLAMLIIDYGHERSGLGDTLQAVRQHQHEHPLTSPGEADLSAQVDFQAIASAARKSGLAADGPIVQAEFLGRLGIVERAHALMTANPAKASAIEIGVARLLAPDSMGTRFKVLGLRSPYLPTLPGFEAPAREAGRS